MGRPMIKVAIADDHRLLLEGLQQALQAVPDLDVVLTAEDGQALLNALPSVVVDVLLVDIDMPNLNGIETVRSLHGDPPAIVVTMHVEEKHRADARQAGAVGFLSKSTPLPDLAAAVRAVHAGANLFAAASLDELLDGHRQPLLDEGAASLTRRERELLGLLASGTSSTDEIADRMFISHKTVKNHLANIYTKLAVADRAQAANASRMRCSMNHAVD